MITYMRESGLSYAIAALVILALFCIPKIRKSPHTMLWRVFFPAFTVVHLVATWWLMGIWFEVDGMSLLDPVVHAWCCFTHIANVIVGGVVNFISDNLYFYFSLRHNLEFHIPFALGSVFGQHC